MSAICSNCGDPWHAGHVCTAGSELAEERFHAGVGVRALQRATGLHVKRIEAQPFPSADARRRYREGLAKLRRSA